ncbi:hypothetical protein [Streptomyces sp. NPDC055287]
MSAKLILYRPDEQGWLRCAGLVSVEWLVTARQTGVFSLLGC